MSFTTLQYCHLLWLYKHSCACREQLKTTERARHARTGSIYTVRRNNHSVIKVKNASWHKICPAVCFGAQMPVSHRWRHCNTLWGIGFTHYCSLIDINAARFFSTEDKLFSAGMLQYSWCSVSVFPVGVWKIFIMSTGFQWTSERTFFWLRCW